MIASIIKPMDEVSPADIAPFIQAYHKMAKLNVGSIEEITDWCSTNWPNSPMISLMDIKGINLDNVLSSYSPAGFYAVLMILSNCSQSKSQATQ